MWASQKFKETSFHLLAPPPLTRHTYFFLSPTKKDSVEPKSADFRMWTLPQKVVSLHCLGAVGAPPLVAAGAADGTVVVFDAT